MTKLLVAGLMLPLFFACGPADRTPEFRSALPEGPSMQTFASTASRGPQAKPAHRVRARSVVTLVMGHTQDALSQ